MALLLVHISYRGIPNIYEFSSFVECLPGDFGPDCQFQCHCKGQIDCDIVNGMCDLECESGWIGESCQTSKKTRIFLLHNSKSSPVKSATVS